MPKAKNSRAHVPAAKEVARYEGHAYLNPDGTVDGEKLLRIVSDAPGAFDLIALDGILDDEDEATASEYHYMVSGIVSGLTMLVMLTTEGDENSAIQLKAIEKLVKPEKYELPLSKIKEIVERYETSPPLARGWELLRLMSLLSNVVEPLKRDQPYLQNQPIKIRETPRAYLIGLWDLARKHLRRNSTLQSLAISIYLEKLQEKGVTDEGVAITEGSLKRDLRIVRQWERDTNEDKKLRRGKNQSLSLTAEPITWYDYSEGWKSRRAQKKASKGGQKV